MDVDEYSLKSTEEFGIILVIIVFRRGLIRLTEVFYMALYSFTLSIYVRSMPSTYTLQRYVDIFPPLISIEYFLNGIMLGLFFVLVSRTINYTIHYVLGLVDYSESLRLANGLNNQRNIGNVNDPEEREENVNNEPSEENTNDPESFEAIREGDSEDATTQETKDTSTDFEDLGGSPIQATGGFNRGMHRDTSDSSEEPFEPYTSSQLSSDEFVKSTFEIPQSQGVENIK